MTRQELVIQPDHRRALAPRPQGKSWAITIDAGEGRVRVGASSFRGVTAWLLEHHQRHRYLGLPETFAGVIEAHAVRVRLALQLRHTLSLTGLRLGTDVRPGSHPVDAVLDPTTDATMAWTLADAGVFRMTVHDRQLRTDEALGAGTL